MKKILSTIMVICMFISLLPCKIIFAADVQWEYHVQVQISDAKDSKSKNGNITGHLLFNDTADEEVFTLNNTKKTGKLSETVHKSSRAPWTLDYVKIVNSSKDAFKILYVKVYVKYGNNSYTILNDKYPNGTGKKDGYWIESGNKKRNNYYTVTVGETDRKFSTIGNFNTFESTLCLNPTSESGKVSYEYNGKVSDQYSNLINGNNKNQEYNCMNMSEAPTVTYDASGTGINMSVNKNSLASNGLKEKDNSMGFEIDREKLSAYMNKNNINKIKVTSTLKFMKGSKDNKGAYKEDTYKKTLTIIRNAFSIGNVGFSDNCYIPITSDKKYNADNKFYNNNIKDSSGNQAITVTATIKTGGNNDNLSLSNLNNATLKYDKATLNLGNTGKKLELSNGSTTVSNGKIQLTFPYTSGTDSKNGGLKLGFENAKLQTESYSSDLYLWDEANKKVGYSYLSSVNKVDAVNPKVTLSAKNNDKLEEWHKTITLTSVPSETLNVAEGKALKEGFYTMELLDENGNAVEIYDYKGKNSPSTKQTVPATESTSNDVTLSLGKVKEGIFTLKLSGQDNAGNSLSQTLENIYLDNQPPNIKIEEVCGLPQSNGKKGNNYNVTITDASGTGKFYYCFTKNRTKAPKPDKNNAEQQTSGTISSLLDKWAFINQSETENGKTASAYIEVEEGSNFSGTLIYFGEDAFGNQTKTYYKDINITNETTKCSIDSKSDTAVPHSSYDIVLTSNSQNTLYYRWQDRKGSYVTDYKKYNGNSINTIEDDKTKNIDGTYVLKCKVVPPSGEANASVIERTFTFDNSAPNINVKPLNTSTYNETQTVSVIANDASGVSEGYAQIVNADGSKIDGLEEFKLDVKDDAISQNINVSDIPSGAYAISVRVIDKNGLEGKSISPVFGIRNSTPDTEVTLISNLSYQDKCLISSEKYKLKIDVTEEFANASKTENQTLYYRVSNSVDTYGEWKKGGAANKGESSLTANVEVDTPVIALVDGENTFYVQTAICNDNADTSKINVNTIKTSEFSFFYDETAPKSRMVIEDIHTAESIKGKVYLSDNFDTELSLISNSNDVVVNEAEDENNTFEVIVNKNVDTTLTATDYAGNKTEIPLVINGIDTTPPTAEFNVKSVYSGARKDGKAIVNIKDVQEGNVKFAFIPDDELSTAVKNGKIADDYFINKVDEINFIQTNSSEAKWNEEKNLTYEVTVAGVSGNYYVGVRMEDSLGNSTDVVADEKISAENTEITYESTVAPKKAGKKSLVKLNFNIPVYLLPQEKIVDVADEDTIDGKNIEATNLEIAKQNALIFSQTHTFTITENGEYKLYTVDDIGRVKAFELNVADVDFDGVGGIKTATYTNDTQITDGKMTCSYNTNVVVEPVNANMLINPVLDSEINNGLTFDEGASEEYKSGEGYTKLVYWASEMYIEDEDGYYVSTVSSNERMLDVYIFEPGSEQSTWSIDTAIIENIDNTPPDYEYKYSPEIIQMTGDVIAQGMEDGTEIAPVTTPGSDYGVKKIYTPSDVTFTATVQDKDSGIESINFGDIWDEINEQIVPVTELPLKDKNGEYIDYTENSWKWSGEQYGCPVTIEYFGDSDPKSVKTIKYTFTDNYRMDAIECYNSAGDVVYICESRLESITTLDCMYKMPIEEGKDYTVNYMYEDNNGNWNEITDNSQYYRRVKAVITPILRENLNGEGGLPVDRELKASNNNGSFEKILDSYENHFTFNLKDKYGYMSALEVSYENFDEISGTIEYVLSNTTKTNKSITVTITAFDNESGVGEVKLFGSNGEIAVTDEGNQYTASISENGAYSIVMYDKVGNKAVKNFNVSNINSNIPTVTGYMLSTENITSKSVSATLHFSKPNVHITSAEPIGSMTSSQFSVNYSTSVITFAESGSLSVFFKDDYGNEGSEVITVNNIDKTPPSLTAVTEVNPDRSEVTVTFEKARDLSNNVIDTRRELSDITVSYGGMAQKVETLSENGTVTDRAKYVFYENGNYTFKTYDDEGLSAYLTLEITDIDTIAPNITEIRWSYEYDLLENGTWQKKTFNKNLTPADEVGYVFASDIHPITNQDVTVTVVTDAATRLVGGSDEYKTENEKVYTDNGLYIFNMQKNNRLTDIYGVDIEVIDKTAPVIDLLGKNELIFYENTAMGEAYNKDYLTKPNVAFKAYDEFGKGTDLNNRVVIKDWGGFNPDDITQNVFDSSIPYTITYEVSDDAHNITEARRTIRLVGMYDTIALVNGMLPDYAGRSEVEGKDITISLKNFSDTSTAYVRYQKGLKTMGQMKKNGTMVSKNNNGEFSVSNLESGWYTFYVQTDKRDYFTLQVYLYN